MDQTYEFTEVLVVDGGSSDNTVAIARELGVQVIKLERRGMTLQRNAGVRYANGELILMVDSDEVLHPQLVEECVASVLTKNLDGLFVITIDTGLTYFGKSRCIGSMINLISRKTDIFIPDSALRFYRRILFQAIGGYDENLLVGEDVVFATECLQRGFEIGKCKFPIHHYGTEGLMNIFMKKLYYGKTYDWYSKKYRELSTTSRNRKRVEVGIFYLRHLFESRKYAKYIPGFLLVKFMETLGLVSGTGIFGFLFR
jgi:glycosyltransferase involved in cell wall biosynthesis